MNKEQLHIEINQYDLASTTMQSLHNLIDKFFELNVCIPKGDNRHLCADVLHAKIENIDLDIEYRYYGADHEFEDASHIFDNIFEYRIKTYEPTYKYQFAYLPMGSIQYEI